MSSGLTPCNSGEICFAEFLLFPSDRAVPEIAEILQGRLGLPQFSFGENDRLIWGSTLRDGVEYIVSSYADPESWHESPEAPAVVNTYLTILVRDSCPSHNDRSWSHDVVVPAAAGIIADALGIGVVHQKTCWYSQGGEQTWNRTILPGNQIEAGASVLEVVPEKRTAPPGWLQKVRITTVDECRPDYQGPLDFAFVVHPRSFDEKLKPFPELRRLPVHLVEQFQKPCVVLSLLEIEIAGRRLRGELLCIPFTPMEIFDRLPDARESLQVVIDYAASRQTRIVGLGALLPSITRQGRILDTKKSDTGVTTGHGFTALTIARFVTEFYESAGIDGPIAIIGAAGSTGRATLRCLLREQPWRSLICVDLPQQLSSIPQPDGWNPEIHHVTADRSSIRDAAVVICVTNAVGSILSASEFGLHAVILDDAQPENVPASVLTERPDLTVIKCLARVPGLHCPFDFGVVESSSAIGGITFTCLAETIVIAATGHRGSFIVGDPTDEQFDFLREHAPRFGIRTAPFFSFPEIGVVALDGQCDAKARPS